jgi:hypothetical protein
MTDNLKLWHQVEKTPIEHTKNITGKSYKGTSPKPHYLVQKATETFGPCGIGWGFSVEERIESGAMIADGFFEKMHIAKVKVWYKWGGERGEVEHIGGTVFSGKYASGKTFTDEDAPKKSVTDALVKALSMIGFAGDIFMGRYDDSKYLQELRQEENEAARQQEPQRQSKADSRPVYTALENSMRMNKTTSDLAAWWKDPDCKTAREKLPQDWQKSLHDQFVQLGFELKREEQTIAGRVTDAEASRHPLNA